MQDSLEIKSFSLPDQKNYEIAYNQAFKLVSEKLSGLRDLEGQCKKSDSLCLPDDSSQKVILKYLNRSYQISLPDIEVSLLEGDEGIKLKDKVLILHYLTRAKGTPLSNKLITYQELREGIVYYPTFVKRAINPLLNFFGKVPEKLLELSGELGGREAAYGDIAVTIPVFSRVPVTLVIWKGDEEFPPNVNVLFDSSILDYLSLEDVIVVCETIAWKLVRSLKALSDNKG